MAVFPTRYAGARSAPFASSIFTSSVLPEKLAAISGVTLERFARFTFAPLSTASRAMSLWPFFSAIKSAVSPRRLREFTAAPPSSRRFAAGRSPCRAATRNWALGERSCAPPETGAKRQRDRANLRINVFSELASSYLCSYSNYLSRFAPRGRLGKSEQHSIIARRIHAHPSPFLHCRGLVLARIRQRSGPGGQGRSDHGRRA